MHKTISHCAAVLALALLAGCSTLQPTAEQQIAIFYAAPTEFARGSLVTLHYPAKHPRFFAIQTPTQHWYFVQSKDDDIELLPAADFAKSTQLVLDTNKLKGVIWHNGKRREKLIFTKAGDYTLYLTDDFEAETAFSLTTIVTMTN